MYAQAGFAIAHVKVPPQEIPLAIGFISLAQIGGATIALAIANSVFLNQATNGILAILPNEPRSVVQSTVSGAGSIFFQTLDPNVRTAVLEAVTHAISRVYILAITGAATSIIDGRGLGIDEDAVGYRENQNDLRPYLSSLYTSTLSPIYL